MPSTHVVDTHNRRLRLEVSAPWMRSAHSFPVRDLSDQRPARVKTYDFFGIIFDGHPALTRSRCPMTGRHPQRKDYLRGIPVEYKQRRYPARRAEVGPSN